MRQAIPMTAAAGLRRGALTGSALLLLGAGPAPRPRERVVTIGETVPVVVNGIAGRLRIDPGAPGLMLLSPDLAGRARLKGGGLLGFGVAYHVGTSIVYGRTAVGQVGLDGARPGKRRIAWTPQPYAPGVDAAMGPAGLGEPVVRFVLRAPVAGERVMAMDLPSNGWLFAGWFPLKARITLGGEPVVVRIAPYARRTLANAQLARRLASDLGGRLDGPATDETIAFGIARPVRTMTLARPFAVGPLALTILGVRVADTGRVTGLPEAGDAPPANADPDEVVVTARSKRKPSPAQLTLGADALARCSSIVFDQPARQVRLSCL